MMSIQKPRIAILTIHPLNYGGVLTVLKIVHHFCTRFFEPTLFFPSFDASLCRSLKHPFNKPSIKETEYFDMQSIEIGTAWSIWEPGHYQNTIHLWQEALKDFDYFFVVSGTVIAAHPLALLKKKHVIWAATSYDEDRAVRKNNFSLPHTIIDKLAHSKMLAIEKQILKQASAIGAMSAYTQRMLEEIRVTHIPKIRYIGVPVNPIESLPDKTATPEKIIIAVGRFDDPRKNADLLFSAFEILYAHDRNTRLVIIGKQPEKYLIEKYKNSPAFDAITLTGHISDAELNTWYRQADLLLITSHQEGLGIIGLEAMAHGIPVVSTDCGGPRDFVYSNKNGFLVPLNDPKSMAQAALKILTDDTLAQTMRKNAYEYVQNNASYKKTEQLFQRMLSDVYPELANLFIQEILP
jgi:glycosyltransferase involved in cell wall biosynthesis